MLKNKQIINYLRVADDTNVLAVTDHLLEAIFNALLAQIISPLLAGFAEGLFLACIPDDRSKQK